MAPVSALIIALVCAASFALTRASADLQSRRLSEDSVDDFPQLALGLGETKGNWCAIISLTPRSLRVCLRSRTVTPARGPSGGRQGWHRPRLRLPVSVAREASGRQRLALRVCSAVAEPTSSPRRPSQARRLLQRGGAGVQRPG
jgi:hypothetical protein